MAYGLPTLPAPPPFVYQALLKADAPNLPAPAPTGGWGLYLDGAQVIIPDSVVAVEFRKDYRLIDYPVEPQGFQSYNKVTMPFEARLTMTKGGNDGDRTDFFNQCQLIAQTTDLYTLVMPEVQYMNCNIEHFDYKRSAEGGIGLLTVEFWLREIRQTVTQTFSNTIAPSGASPVNLGLLFAQLPSETQVHEVLTGTE